MDNTTAVAKINNNSSKKDHDNPKLSTWTTTLIVAGTGVGAGMFSLPIVTSGMWFGWSLFILFTCWFVAYSAALYLVEVALCYQSGASFDTLTKETLGQSSRIINGIAVVFTCYVLLYAYVSGGGSAIIHGLGLTQNYFSAGASQGNLISAEFAGSLFVICLAAIIIIGPSVLGPITTIMLGGMVLTFVDFTAGLVSEAKFITLFPNLPITETAPYVFAALPAMMVSFGFHSCVPSVIEYLDQQPKPIIRSIQYGSSLALALYVLWQLSTLGNIPRNMFPSIIANGGNIGDLVSALEASKIQITITWALTIFSHLALASSFIGVALGLLGYVTDFMQWSHDITGRFKAALVTFLPPATLGFFYPSGFTIAIGFAGIGATTFCILFPAIMAWKNRKNRTNLIFTVPGGNLRIGFVILISILVILCELLERFDMLPVFK